jgi:hypothetical protein
VRTPPALRRWLCRVASQCDPSFQGHRRRLISKPVGFCRAKPARWLAYGSISAMPVGVRGCGPASCLNGGSCARRGRALARHYSLCRLAVWFGEPRRASGSKSHRQLSGLPSSLFPRPSTLDPRPFSHTHFPPTRATVRYWETAVTKSRWVRSGRPCREALRNPRGGQHACALTPISRHARPSIPDPWALVHSLTTHVPRPSTLCHRCHTCPVPAC